MSPKGTRCSQNAASVAAFYSPDGSLTINDGPLAVGRAAITEAAQQFITSFPDMKVLMDGLTIDGDQVVYHWTLQGTNMTPKITLTDTPDDGIIKALAKKLMDFNKVGSGRPLDYRSLTIFLTHPDTGELLGGLWGGTSYSYLHIELLYLPDELRGAGLGRQLMTQAEQEAIQRGCRGVWLDTFSFQARGFYERLGYTVFGTLEDYPPGHSRFFLRKNFEPKDPSF